MQSPIRTPSPISRQDLVVVTVLLLVIVLVVMIANPVVVRIWSGCDDPEKVAGFATQFGLAGTLFSGLAFVGVGVAVWYQHREAQIREAEAGESQELVQRQLRESSKQSAERTFFQMLELFQDVKDRLQKPTKSEIVTGAEAANRYVTELGNHIVGGSYERGVHIPNPPQLTMGELRAKIDSYSSQTLSRHCSHVFRMAYVLLKHIHETDLLDDKAFYIRVFRAQCEEPFLVLLAYNSLGTRGMKMFPLVERYHLLENLSSGSLIIPAHRDFFQSRFAEDAELNPDK